MSEHDEKRRRREAERYAELRSTDYELFTRAVNIGNAVTIALSPDMDHDTKLAVAAKVESMAVSLALEALERAR